MEKTEQIEKTITLTKKQYEVLKTALEYEIDQDLDGTLYTDMEEASQVLIDFKRKWEA